MSTARGSVVDELALVKALQNGMIAGAGLDVFATEPFPLDHPLRSTEKVVLVKVDKVKLGRSAKEVLRRLKDGVLLSMCLTS